MPSSKLNISIPDGWRLYESKQKSLDSKDFSPPNIPSDVSAQARGKDSYKWQDPETGRTYIKEGRVWKRENNDTQQAQKSSAPEKSSKQSVSAILDASDKNLITIANEIDKKTSSVKKNEPQSSKSSRSVNHHTAEDENKISNDFLGELFNIAKGLLPKRTKEENQRLDEIMNVNIEDSYSDNLDGLNSKRDEMKEKYGLPSRYTDAAILWGEEGYVQINGAIYNPENATEGGKIPGRMLNEMLHTMPGYTHKELMDHYQSQVETPLTEPVEEYFLPEGTLQRGESFSNPETRENLLQYYEDGLGKEHIFDPRIIATTGLKKLDNFLKKPTTKYIIHSKTDGTTRGVAMDQFKDKIAPEGEVAYPSYTPFKVLKVDRIRDAKDPDAPYIRTSDYTNEYTPKVLDSIDDEGIRNALKEGGHLSLNQLQRMRDMALYSSMYHDRLNPDDEDLDPDIAGAERIKKKYMTDYEPMSQEAAFHILQRFSPDLSRPYAEIHLQEL